MKTNRIIYISSSLWREIRRRSLDFLAHLQRKKSNSGYLFIAINGAGLGHLTRCLAIARRLREQTPNEKIVFVTTSIAVPLVHQAGFVCHHIPPFASIGNDVSSRQWHDLFYNNLTAVLKLHSPSTLIFDGSIPYDGMLRAMKDFTKMNRVWIKRGLYKSAVDSNKLLMYTKKFDLTINPGELNDDVREKNVQSITSVDPILMLDHKEMLDRGTAKGLLRLREGTPAVFIQLGAGNINEISELQEKVVLALKKIGAQIVLAQSPIALRKSIHSLADNTLFDFPSSRYYEAFDFAVLAGGYNSVNEAVFLGLPAIFMPNMTTVADDQLRRCYAAKTYGDYEVLEIFDEEKLLQMASYLIDRKHHPAKTKPSFRNGAQQAVELIVNLADSRKGAASRR